MMKNSNIYVMIAGYIFQGIYIHPKRINSQHFMVVFPLSQKFQLTHTKNERFLEFMLEDRVYTICPLDWVKVEIIANIQCYIYARKIHFTKKTQGIFPIFLLESLVILYSFGSWCMDGIYNQHSTLKF